MNEEDFFIIYFYEGENFTLMWWVILSLRKLLQTAIGTISNFLHWSLLISICFS